MNLSNINPKEIIFSLDIGTRSIIGTVGVVRDKKFHVLGESYTEHHERAMVDGQIHNINLVAEGVSRVKRELEKELNITLTNVAIAAAGRFLRTTTVRLEENIELDKEIDKDTINSIELTAVKKAEEEVNNSSKGKLYCVGYSVKNYYLNGYIISNLLGHKGEDIAVELIATFLPRSVVDSLYAVMDRAGLCVINLTLEPIAAMEAAVPQNLRLLNLALVDIGAGTSDIAISNKDSIVAYGMVPMAGDEATEVIAQTYLTDFNAAEKIKRESTNNEVVKYVDVLGLENEISSEEIHKVIKPVVDKIGEEVSTKIIDLNGGKAPNAIFLVGGGAHTPGLKEVIAERLNLPLQRVAIKGREAVLECVCKDNSLGSIGVTVLGIALDAIKKSGNDFINVTLNDKVISLFNSHRHTVMDLIVQAGISPKLLLGKKGKSKRFIVNGIKRVAFGKLPENPVIKINDLLGSMDSDIKDGDKVFIEYAKDGADAQPKIIDYVKELQSTSFYLNDIIHNLEPVLFINEKQQELKSNINENDNVEIMYPSTIGEFHKYMNRELSIKNFENVYYLNNKPLEYDYIIQEGDRIYIKDLEIAVDAVENNSLNNESIKETYVLHNNQSSENDKIRNENQISKSFIEEKTIENQVEIVNEENYRNFHEQEENAKYEEINNLDGKEKIEKVAESMNVKNKNTEDINEEIIESEYKNKENTVEVIVNESPIVLKGKDKYVFIDVFDYIDFDLSKPQGILELNLNGNRAEYYDELNRGDRIDIYWRKKNL